MLGYIGVAFCGVAFGVLLASLFANKSPQERQKDDEEQIEYLRKLAEKEKENEDK